MILEARNLTKLFIQGNKELDVISAVTISFRQGSTYAITGVSGSGKSTFLHLLAGLENPTSGDIFLDGVSVKKLRTDEKQFSSKIGMMFQFHYLIKELTVSENCMLMGMIADKKNSMIKDTVQRLLSIVGLSDKINAYPTQLSGGEQQRVALVRALFNKPAFLLADEPTGSLDKENAQLVVQLLLQAQREWGMGIILCSHDKEVYQQMQTVYRVHQGVLSIETES